MTMRSWEPDVRDMADELIEDYRKAAEDYRNIPEEQGNEDAMNTIASWLAKAARHGEEFTEDDWVCLVQELARRCANSGE